MLHPRFHRPLCGVAQRLGLSATIAFVLALAPTLARQGLAQQEPSAQPPPQGFFSESVEVRVVNVEVVVTDREGNRIQGLGAEDFELVVDKQPTAIDYFTEVLAGRSVARAAGTGDAGPAEVPTLRAGQEVGTSYLVFLDEYFSEPVDRNIVVDALMEQIVALGPADRMAIVAYNGDELSMISNWSQSSDDLVDALRRARGRKAFGLRRMSELRQSDTALPDPNLDRLDLRLSLEERAYVSRLESQLDRVVTAATSTLRSFGGPPGRKVMLLYAGAWPFDPVEFIVNDTTRPVFERDVARGEELFAPLVDAANLLGYTLYVADVAGLDFTGLVGADAVAPRNPTQQDFIRETAIHHTFLHLAESTGGRAFLNGARRDAFAETQRDTRSYYWLGFSPERKADDTRHVVEVRLRDPERFGRKVDVRFREDYLDISRQSEVTMAVESALYFGSPPSPAPLKVQIGRPEGSSRRKMVVPLVLEIPIEAMTLIPTGAPEGEPQFVAQLELRVAVLDDKGSTSDIPVIPLNLAVREKPEPGAMFRYQTSLKMRRREHDVVVAVYDVPSSTMLSSSVEVKP